MLTNLLILMVNHDMSITVGISKTPPEDDTLTFYESSDSNKCVKKIFKFSPEHIDTLVTNEIAAAFIVTTEDKAKAALEELFEKVIKPITMSYVDIATRTKKIGKSRTMITDIPSINELKYVFLLINILAICFTILIGVYIVLKFEIKSKFTQPLLILSVCTVCAIFLTVYDAKLEARNKAVQALCKHAFINNECFVKAVTETGDSVYVLEASLSQESRPLLLSTKND